MTRKNEHLCENCVSRRRGLFDWLRGYSYNTLLRELRACIRQRDALRDKLETVESDRDALEAQCDIYKAQLDRTDKLAVQTITDLREKLAKAERAGGGAS